MRVELSLGPHKPFASRLHAGSPLYRPYRTPAGYHARFGAGAAQVKAVRSRLTGAGLKIISSSWVSGGRLQSRRRRSSFSHPM